MVVVNKRFLFLGIHKLPFEDFVVIELRIGKGLDYDDIKKSIVKKAIYLRFKLKSYKLLHLPNSF